MLPAMIAAQQTPPTTNAQQTPPAKTPHSPAAKSRPTGTAKTQPPLTLKTQKEKVSYAIGMNMGKSMQRQSVQVDPNILARGLKDALAGGKTLMTDEEAKATMTQFQTEMRKAQEEKMQQASMTNKKEGTAFLEANKTKEGVKVLPSGLQYKVLKEGTGPKPSAADTVVCNYRGTLIDGKEFDSSYKRGEPATFPVNGVIKGWTEALQLMPVGSKWQLFLPADLAYGDRGAGADIGPGATLIFEVELMSIQPAKPAEAKPAEPAPDKQ
jgi:FKBP-type peptidyl-prolyl cis-trans isomerase